jgi:hypothetical protein
VGDPTEVFSFEKRIAVTRSDFFKTAVGGGGRWREGVSNWIRMPKDDAVMFRKYLHLLRTGTVATSHDTSIVGTLPHSKTYGAVLTFHLERE